MGKRDNNLDAVIRAGISYDDAVALRRISMTLRRWFELECGNSNTYGAWAIVRDDNGDGPPYMERHHYLHGRGKDYTTRTRIPDRETGARKRLAKILAQYPGYQAYVQTDPRGCALHLLRPGDVPEGMDVSSYYNRGVPVY